MFQIGDKIRCVDRGQYTALENGQVYTVDYIGPGTDHDLYVGIFGHKRPEYMASRFVLVAPVGGDATLESLRLLAGVLSV